MCKTVVKLECIFTMLHGMQTSSNENSVCLSVRLSKAWIMTKQRKICPDFILYERSLSLVFREECLVGATRST